MLPVPTVAMKLLHLGLWPLRGEKCIAVTNLVSRNFKNISSKTRTYQTWCIAKNEANRTTHSLYGYTKPPNYAILSRYAGVRNFRTTPPNHIPAIAWVVIRAVGKFAAVLTGRRLRMYWKNLDPAEKAKVYEWLRRNRGKLSLGLILPSCAFYWYYVSHIQEAPITKRRRFICFTPSQFKEMAEFECQANMLQYQNRILPPRHPLCRRVEAVAMRLLNANKDIPEIYDKKWSVVVVNADEIKNAFVLPTGVMFVFTGMLNVVDNDDQLGIVLAHEMSHAILNHGAELMSLIHIMDFFVICALTLLWAILPTDYTAAFTTWLFNKVLQLTIQLPYNRKLETEADEVGLLLAAKACFDVRESVVFWKMMSLTEKIHFSEIFGGAPKTELPEQIAFLSTHPSHDSRAEHIQSLLPEAIKRRTENRCPSLSSVDPNLLFEKRKKLLDKRIESQRQQQMIVLKLPPR